MIDFSFRKTFRTQTDSVVLDLTGTAPEGRITAVLGKSGSGKTSLAMMMAGLLRTDEGYFSVSGNVFEDTRAGHGEDNGRRSFFSFFGKARKPTGLFTPPEERGIGFVFQNHRLLPYRTVRENIRYPVRHGRRTPRIAFNTVVDLLGLADLLDRLPSTLSGGQAQRVSLGRALLASQTMLIMDEPTASLDPALRGELTDYICRIPEVCSLSVLYITHHVEEAMSLTDQAILIENGKVAARGTPEELASFYAQGFQVNGAARARAPRRAAAAPVPSSSGPM